MHAVLQEISDRTSLITEVNQRRGPAIPREERADGTAARAPGPGEDPAIPENFDKTLGGIISSEGAGTVLRVSGTLTRKGDHVYDHWLDRLMTFLMLVIMSIKACVGLEAGPRAGHMHAAKLALHDVSAYKWVEYTLSATAMRREGGL